MTKLYKLFINVTCMLIGISGYSFANDNYNLKDLKECTPRNGLPNFFHKLNNGEHVKIVYFGGSITVQNGYRVLSQEYFQKEYPEAKVEGINAAIGGTGSDLGVFRMERDVQSHNPDLVIIEFSVNDHYTNSETIRMSFEGIIRKIWKQNPNCDICFVYTVVERDKENLFSGKMKRTASIMEEVAEHYGIPTIHMGVEIAGLYKEGKLVFKEKKEEMTRVSGTELNKASGVFTNKDGVIPFSKDGVHPYTDTGHVLYMEAISRSIPIIKAAGKNGPHNIPAAMGYNYEEAKMIPLSQGNISKTGLTKLDNNSAIYRKASQRMPELWKAEPGAKISFSFTGSKVLIYDMCGPGCGSVKVTVDGKISKKKRIDPYCTYYRISTLSVAPYLRNSLHTVEIEVLSEDLDKRNILFEKNRIDYDRNKEKYKENNWYPGAILVIGDLSK